MRLFIRHLKTMLRRWSFLERSHLCSCSRVCTATARGRRQLQRRSLRTHCRPPAETSAKQCDARLRRNCASTAFQAATAVVFGPRTRKHCSRMCIAAVYAMLGNQRQRLICMGSLNICEGMLALPQKLIETCLLDCSLRSENPF